MDVSYIVKDILACELSVFAGEWNTWFQVFGTCRVVFEFTRRNSLVGFARNVLLKVTVVVGLIFTCDVIAV